MPIKIDDKNVKKIIIQRQSNTPLNVLAVYAEGDYRFCFSFPKSYWLTRSSGTSANSYQLPYRATSTSYTGWLSSGVTAKFSNNVNLYNSIKGTNYSPDYQNATIKVPFVKITNTTTARNNVFLAVYDANNNQVGGSGVKNTLAANEVFNFPILDTNANTFQYSAWNTSYTIKVYYQTSNGSTQVNVKYIQPQVEFTPTTTVL